MPFVDERFEVIHKLLIQQNLVVLPGPFNSQADIYKAYRESAVIMTRAIPHEAGHAIMGLALDAGDVLEWIAIYVFRSGAPGGGCSWGHKACPVEYQWMSLTGGMAGEKVKYGDYLATSAQIDKAQLLKARCDLKQLSEYVDRSTTLIRNHESAWNALQQLLYERTVRDLTDRIDAIRQGDADVGVVTGQEARDIFAGRSS